MCTLFPEEIEHDVKNKLILSTKINARNRLSITILSTLIIVLLLCYKTNYLKKVKDTSHLYFALLLCKQIFLALVTSTSKIQSDSHWG